MSKDAIPPSEIFLERSVERILQIERHGFVSDNCKTMSVEDRRALDMLVV